VKRWTEIILLLCISILFLFYYHGDVIINSNSINLGDDHDGLKNYYTPYYHIVHDKEYNHFEGMNYPYGEHVTFTDCQPALSGSLKFIDQNIIEISSYTIGIINCSMFFSIVLASLFIFLILRHYKLHLVRRMFGHYALSYGFVIPYIWFFLLTFSSKNRIRNSLFIASGIFIFSGLHFYLFAISAAFVLLYFGFKFLEDKNWKTALIDISLTVVLPLFCIVIWIGITDTVSDRPANPTGFLGYRGFWESIFLPIDFRHGNWIDTNIIPIRNVPWESLAYVGLPACLFSIFILISLFISKRRKDVFFKDTLNRSFLASIVLLIFSFGIPFIYGLESLLDFFGPLKQFRGISRFSWVFFYVINTLLIVFVWQKCKNGRKHIILISALLVLIYEVDDYNQRIVSTKEKASQINILTEHSNEELEKLFSENDFQAIIPLPYFHSGSEVIYGPTPSLIVKDVFQNSLKYGIPTSAVMMSRTSLEQTLEQLRFVRIEDNITMSKLWKNKKNKAPYLIWTRTDLEINNEEQELLKLAHLVFEDPPSKLYSIQSNRIVQYYNREKNTITDENISTDSSQPLVNLWSQKDNFTTIRNDSTVFKGSFEGTDSTIIEMSFWTKFKPFPRYFSRFIIHQVDSLGNNVSYLTRHFGETYLLSEGDSALCRFDFVYPTKGNNVLIHFQKKKNEDIRIGSFMLRDKMAPDYYEKVNGRLRKNNRFLN